MQPERVLDVARNALRRLTERRHVTLVVNPADLELVSECVEQLQSELGGIEHLDVQSDRRVGRGGVVARTNAGEIDAGIDTQLARAREIVAGSARRATRPAMSELRARRPTRSMAPTCRAASGRVRDLIGLIIEATGLQVEIGEVCMVGDGRDRAPVATEVVGFRGGRTLLMPLGELHGIGPGTTVHPTGGPFRVAVGEPLLGRVIDGLGKPLDGFGALWGGLARARPPRRPMR